MTDITQALADYHHNLLKDMAQLLGVTTDSITKRDHIKALEPFLLTPEAVKRGLARLGKREKEVLSFIQRCRGGISAARLRRQLLRLQVIGPSPRDPYGLYSNINVLASESRRTSFDMVVGRLLASGLVWGKGLIAGAYSQRSRIYYDNVQTLYIPQEIEGLLPPPPPPEQHVFSAKTLTHIEAGSARTFQRDLYFYWSATRTEPLSLTQDGRLYQRDLGRINGDLIQQEELKHKNEWDVPRLLFMRRLLTHMGILVTKKHRITAVDRPKFLGQSGDLRIQRAFESWREGAFWNEILSIPNLRIVNLDDRLQEAPPSIVKARQCVLDHIAQTYQEDWTSLEKLIDHIRMSDYEFLLPRHYEPPRSSYYYYYSYTSRTPYSAYGNKMGWTFTPTFSDEEEGWEVVEAGFIRAVLFEPLYWMGLVDIGYTDERPVAYRLTPVGAWVLGVGPAVEIPEGEGRVIVQPNFEIFALDPISDLTLAKLDEFADRESAERVMKYTLTRESVYRAQKAKWTTERIIQTLQKMSDNPLPQNVVRTLEEWQGQHERITIHRNASLLQTVDKPLLDTLMENPAVQKHIASRPGETIAVIAPPPYRTSALVQALHNLDHLPAQTASPQDALRPSFTIDQDGQLRFREALPSIYLFEQIAPLTERDEQGQYYLTQTAIRNALRGKQTVDDILNRLQTLHIGPLSHWVQVKVRAWGNYYGDAAIQALILVQVRDQETLRQLLQEPEVAQVLAPFKADGKKALAVVAPQDLESLRELFAERGMAIKEELE